MERNTKTKYIDYLDEDDPINGQTWVCISFLSPEGVKNCSMRGLKIRGVYDTREEADSRAKDLQDVDPDFHVFVGEVGKWCPWDPDVNSIKDQVYAEKELNDLMKGYKDNLQKAKKMQHQRKNDMINNAATQEEHTELSKTDQRKARMQKKLEERRAQKQLNNLSNRDVPTSEDHDVNNDKKSTKNRGKRKKRNKDINTVISEDELVDRQVELEGYDVRIKEERKRLSENETVIGNQQQKITSIDDQLAKIKSLYEKVNKINKVKQEN
jgi:hypothetical protein